MSCYAAISSYALQARPNVYEVFRALRHMTRSNVPAFMHNKWFVLTGASAVLILSVLLFVARRVRLDRQRHETVRQFDEECYSRGLTASEQEILHAVSRLAGLKRMNSIFTMITAFNRGSSKLMQEYFAGGANVAERKRLNAAVNMLRNKLGFENRKQIYGTRRSSGGLSSRMVPIGKHVVIVPSGVAESRATGGVVTRNDDLEIVVRPDEPISASPGQTWKVRYRFGPATWEFNAVTLACDRDGLELSHCDNIHFVNRRRFVRAAVKRPASIAFFPVTVDDIMGNKAVPQFVEAMVTEISGPGLRIKTDMELQVNDRLIIIFELEAGKVIQDIAEVRGFRNTPLGHSVGVELIGLSDSAVDELVRTTNKIVAERRTDGTQEEMELVGTGGSLYG